MQVLKPLIFSGIFVFLCFNGFSNHDIISDKNKNQETESLKKNFFYTSPFQLFFGHFQIGYERDFGKQNNSILFNTGVWLMEGHNYDRLGVSAEIQMRWSLYEKAAEKSSTLYKLYFGPFAQFHYNEITSDDYWHYDPFYYPNQESHTDIITSGGMGIIIGNRFVFFERLSIDLYFGGGVKYTQVESEPMYYGPFGRNSVMSPYYSGVFPKTRLQIGIAF